MFSHRCDFRKGEEAARAEGERHYRRARVTCLVACIALLVSTGVFPSPWSLIPIGLIGAVGIVIIHREMTSYSKCRDEAIYLRGYGVGRQAR